MPGKEANQVAVDALKQALTLASLILALTVTFLKDVLGDNRGDAILILLLPLCWFFLLITIWMGWIAMADAARKMSKKNTDDYVFSSGLTRKLARTAQWSFLLALTCLGVFAIINYRNFFLDKDGQAAHRVERGELQEVEQGCTQSVPAQVDNGDEPDS